MDCCDVVIVVSTPEPIVVSVPVEETIAVVVCEQGPAGPPGADGVGGKAPVPVPTSRTLNNSTDAGAVLQCVNGITLTVPTGLPVAFATQLLVNASQVSAGGAVTVSPAVGVSINGAPGTSWLVERTVGSTSPWMAWLQHETGTDAYSMIVIGATLTALVGASDVYEIGVYETGIYE